ncbi:MAG TPA: STAS domain-containing protein [Pirellulales bacterium]|jgi:anti-anti-sigma regulatory factor|nr:STAS domain-containing protein [Pirellulales bacterium]
MHNQPGNQLSLLGEDLQAVRLELSGAVSHDQRATDSFQELGGPKIYSRKVMVDLSKCHYVNSGGVAWLLIHHRRFQEAGGKLVLHSASPVVRQIFSLMKMELVLNFCHDLPEAERLLKDAL